jgi:hypothetical protein
MLHVRKRPTRSRLFLMAVALVAVMAAFFASMAVQPASAHRSGCHRWHSCPSDLYTYRWHGLLCTSHNIDKIRVVYQGRTYWCHR